MGVAAYDVVDCAEPHIGDLMQGMTCPLISAMCTPDPLLPAAEKAVEAIAQLLQFPLPSLTRRHCS